MCKQSRMGSMSSKQSRVVKRSKTLVLESKNYLPEEIIEEILFKLPAKSILRFKCVSKQWRSLISSKQFIKHHLAKNLSSSDHHNLIILLSNLVNQGFRSCSLRSLRENSTVTSFDYHPLEADHIPIAMTSASSDDTDYYTFGRHYNPATHYPTMMMAMTSASSDNGQYYPRDRFLIGILGSCNGLILITIDKGNLFIWNPTTRQAKNIAPPESHGFTHAWELRSGYYFVYGFGYDESTDDYKIVCIFVTCREKPRKAATEIYSLRTNSWKRIESFDKGFMFMYTYNCGRFTNGKFVKGKLHWLTSDEHGRNWGIVALDLAEEKYEIVGRPEYFSNIDTRSQPRLHDLGGYLSLTSFDENLSDMDVWVMTKYGETESWIKFWTFCPNKTMADDTIRGIFPCPLWLTIENGDIVLCFPVATGLLAVVFNGSNHNVLHKSRVDIVDPTNFYSDFEANVYVESLVSPFGDEQ